MDPTQPPSTPNLDAQFDQVYDQLKALARNKLRQERKGHTLNTTGLVHEVYMKLSSQQKREFENEGHFMALAAQAMRRILVDHARKQKRLKRGGNALVITHQEDKVFLETTPEQMLALHEALTRLEALNQRQARVVENWFFGGFSHKEIAKILDTSIPTVRRDWRLARLWLSKELKREVDL